MGPEIVMGCGDSQSCACVSAVFALTATAVTDAGFVAAANAILDAYVCLRTSRWYWPKLRHVYAKPAECASHSRRKERDCRSSAC